MRGYQLTAVIQREGNIFVALCVELDIASEGPTGAKALGNLKESVRMFLDTARDDDILRRLAREVDVTMFEVELRQP